MAQITGIGGFFFRARDPEALAAWYDRHLGIGWRGEGPWQQAAGPTILAPFRQDTDYFPADRQWLLNLRVDDLAGMMARLQVAGIAVETRPEEWDSEVGNFARIHDPEGNPIELWQPRA
ncbi:VOC family protein [uncultured Paracoccus sp.]|uniref:VOC family protein n=1 Tax=uncultured Paracoccus sp. TaxID=189685 RepID=UPI002639EC33|nr:VOC family protein [uncultured Paracoccus sp.]